MIGQAVACGAPDLQLVVDSRQAALDLAAEDDLQLGGQVWDATLRLELSQVPARFTEVLVLQRT